MRKMQGHIKARRYDDIGACRMVMHDTDRTVAAVMGMGMSYFMQCRRDGAERKEKNNKKFFYMCFHLAQL